MPTVTIAGGWTDSGTTPEPVEGDLIEASDWGESVVWYNTLDLDLGKTPRIAKDLKELLGEPDWEI
jgi:hypothetical protein